MSDVQIVPVHVSPPDDEFAESAEALSQPPAANPLAQLHSLLRGRYHWAALLGLLGAGLGVFIGHKVPPVKYRSAAIVRILPSKQRILYQSEQNTVMPMFDAFVESQATLITNARTLNLAMQDAEWQAMKRGISPKAEKKFRDSIEVEHPRNSEMILIFFTDEDPGGARAGASAVLRAYKSMSGEYGSDDPTKTLPVLETRLRELNTTLTQKKNAIAEQAALAGFGTSSLAPFYEFQAQQYNNIKAEIQQADLLLASIDVSAPNSAATRPGAAPLLTAEAIAPFDPALQALLRQRAEQRPVLRKLEGRYGPQYQQVIDAKAALSDLNKEIEERVTAFANSANDPGAARNVPVATASSGTVSVGGVRLRRQKLLAMEQESQAALIDLGKRKQQIDQLLEDANAVEKNIGETHTRIEQLKLEDQASSRINTIDADVPLEPHNDKRVAAAAGGGVGGGALGIGSIALFGLINRRLRSFADAKSVFARDLRLLGIVPILPAEMGDAEQASAAAHCLHHIRSALQIQRSSADERVYVITSPSPGAGKTSTTLALGLSFAAAKSKTLLIDFDIIGAGLSSRIRNTSHRKLGRILVGEGLISDGQLQRALVAGKKYGKRLGEVLVKAGWLTTADIAHALDVQGQSPLGLLDVMAGENLADCVTWTGVPGLFVLPVGTARAAHVGQISPAAVREIATAARQDYDAVLVDTGPLLGSLEASIVSAEADKVVMVLSRGESRSNARKALTALQTSGARLAGVVFNRATADDVEISGYSSTRSTGPSSRPLIAVKTMSNDGNLHVGPLGHAVMSSTASHTEPVNHG